MTKTIDYDLQEIRALYPFQSNFFDLGPDRMHYLDEGQGDTTILMVHGNPTWSFYYRDLIQSLKHQHRCIAPDHIGMGLSSKPQDYRYQLGQHIDNLVGLIRHLDLQKIHLVVHDWGGPIGIGAALEETERFDHITILNTIAFPSAHLPWQLFLARLPLVGDWLIRRLNLFIPGTLYWASRSSNFLSTDVKKGYYLPYNSWENRVALHRFIQDIPMSRNHPSSNTLHRIDTQLHRLQELPIQLMWGMQDFIFSDHFIAQWQDYYPHIEVHRLHDVGHLIADEASSQVSHKISEFIYRHEKL